MNREIQITIIACAIVFAGIAVLAVETMNSDQVIKPQIKRPSETIIPESNMASKVVEQELKKADGNVELPKDIKNKSVESLIEFPITMMKTLDDKTSIHKTITGIIIPEDNEFPWGTVQGKVTNPALGHPVIIKFFKSLDDVPVHVAQVDLNDNNTFEYQFRLLSIDNDITTRIFDGEYYIEIFKTVNTP
jgi:hypothetical protein